MRHGLLRPPMYGEPGGLQGEITIAQLLVGRRVRHAGGRQVAHGRERGVAAAERRLRRLLRVPLACPTCTPSGATRTSSRRSSYSEERTSWIENQPFNKCFVHAHEGRRARERRGGHDPGALAARRQVGRLLARLRPTHGAAASSPGSSTTARAARTSTTIRTRDFLGHVAGKASVQGHDHRARRHRRPAGRRRSRRRDSSTTRSSSSRRTTARRWRPGPTRRTHRSAARRARRGRAASGCRASSRGPG